MKILHLLSQMPDFTGSGKFIQEMIRQSDKKGHDSFLLAGAQADFKVPQGLVIEKRSSFVRFDGMDLDFTMPGMSDIMPYKSSRFSKLSQAQIESYKVVFKRKIKEAVQYFAPDVIHSHHLWIASAVARRSAPDIAQVTTCHGTCLRQHYFCPDISPKIRDDLQKIDAVIALSQSQKAMIEKTLAIDSKRISIISGGYNEKVFYPVQKVFNKTVHILYAGKISAPKGVPWLLKSLEKIKNLPFVLHMAGNASKEEVERCLFLADRLGKKAVYHGALTHQELGDLMRKSHIFILPSFYEGLPLVLMEALACGCRIITTALPGVHEIFKIQHPEMVRMIELPELETIDKPYAEDEPEMERKLSELLKTSIQSVAQDPEPDMDFVETVVKDFTWDKIYKKVEQVYEKTMAGKDRSIV